MARTREFNADEALNSAMELFWERGYLDVSVDDLVEKTGVSRYGLYSVWGNKHGLFLASLDLYAELLAQYRLGPMEVEGASIPELHTFIGMLAEPEPERTDWGCLMCNTGAELGPLDAEAESRVNAYLERMVRAIEHVLGNAVSKKELDLDASKVPGMASWLATSVLGLCVGGRFATGRVNAAATIEFILDQFS